MMKTTALRKLCLVILAIAACCFASAPSSAQQLRYVQWSTGDSGATTRQTTYLGKSVAGGNLLLAFAHWDNQSVTATLSDQKGNKYVPLSPPVNVGAHERYQVWMVRNASSGELHVNIDFSARTTSYSVLDVLEYAGADRKDPLAGFAFKTGAGTAQNSGPLHLAEPGGVSLIGLIGYETHALPYFAGEGFQFREYEATTLVEERLTAGAGTHSATARSANPTNWVAFAVAIRHAKN